jgi:hypothetical protein
VKKTDIIVGQDYAISVSPRMSRYGRDSLTAARVVAKDVETEIRVGYRLKPVKGVEVELLENYGTYHKKGGRIVLQSKQVVRGLAEHKAEEKRREQARIEGDKYRAEQARRVAAVNKKLQDGGFADLRFSAGYRGGLFGELEEIERLIDAARLPGPALGTVAK